MELLWPTANVNAWSVILIAMLKNRVLWYTVSRRRSAHYLRNAHPPFWGNVDVNAHHSTHTHTGDCKQVVIWPSTFLFIILIMEYLPIHWELTEFLLLKSTNSFILCATMCVMCVAQPLSMLLLTANAGNLISTDLNTDGRLQGYN